MPTIAAFLQLLPRGFRSAPYRSTDASVCVATEGSGRSIVDGQGFDWSSRDIFVVPSWAQVIHESADDAVLFSFSDRSAQVKLGYWREQRGES